MPQWELFLILLAVMEAFVALQGFLSWRAGLFSRRQMVQVQGIAYGYAFLEHGGMWSDVFVISPIVSYVIAFGGLNLASPMSSVVMMIALIAWACLAIDYARRSWEFPEAHAFRGRITGAGWIHLVFAVIGTWAILLFGLSRPPVHQLVVVAIFLTPFFHLGVRKFSPRWKLDRAGKFLTFVPPVVLWVYVWWTSVHAGT